MFKVRMQGQYGDKTDKRLRDVAKEMWSQWGFRKGIMRGYWVTEWLLSDYPSQYRYLHRLPSHGRFQLTRGVWFSCDTSPVKWRDACEVSTLVTKESENCWYRWHLILPAFEFTKRQFKKTYGAELPVWALLLSGSTGGVRPKLVDLSRSFFHISIDCILARLLSIGYAVLKLEPLYIMHYSPFSLDVIKSRIQLRSTPPSGTPVQYIAREFKTIIQESGTWVVEASFWMA